MTVTKFYFQSQINFPIPTLQDPIPRWASLCPSVAVDNWFPLVDVESLLNLALNFSSCSVKDLQTAAIDFMR